MLEGLTSSPKSSAPDSSHPLSQYIQQLKFVQTWNTLCCADERIPRGTRDAGKGCSPVIYSHKEWFVQASPLTHIATATQRALEVQIWYHIPTKGHSWLTQQLFVAFVCYNCLLWDVYLSMFRSRCTLCCPSLL